MRAGETYAKAPRVCIPLGNNRTACMGRALPGSNLWQRRTKTVTLGALVASAARRVCGGIAAACKPCPDRVFGMLGLGSLIGAEEGSHSASHGWHGFM